MNPKYRAEIDGLRTMAVLPVVLYHAGLGGLTGGFVGVDIFFVISGYLISGIILGELRGGTFTFSGFYERRIRRIVPALLVVILASLVTATLVALPSQLRDTAASSIAAILSASNFYFWSQSGYFSPAAELMPLLHTWSLGVEEQFYLLFPIFLFLCARTKIQTRLILLLCFPPLLVAAVWLSYNKPSVAFYLLPARAWELSLGALLAANAIPVVRNAIAREALSFLGFILIIASISLLDSRMVFPGWIALAPCLGAVLVIHCAQEGTLVRRILSAKPIVFVGLISYSLYLWHWPVLAFERMYFANMRLTIGQSIGAVILSFFLAISTWRYVETPFRSRSAMPTRRLSIVLGMSLTALLGLLLVGFLSGGLPTRLGSEATRLLSASEDVDPISSKCLKFDDLGRTGECKFGPEGLPVSYAIIGDSHAAAVRSALQASKPFGQRGGTLWWRGACPFLLGARTVPDIEHFLCTAMKDRAIRELRNSPEITHVVLAGRWALALSGVAPEIGGSYRTFLSDDETHELSGTETEMVFQRSMSRTVDQIVAMGKSVIIIGDVPEPGFDVPRILALASFNRRSEPAVLSRNMVLESNRRVDEVFYGISSARRGVYYVPVWDIFCESDCSLMRDGVPLYSDDDHITYQAATSVVGPELGARLKKLNVE